MSNPLTLLWRRTSLDRVPESYFIERVLLAGLGRPVRVVAIERWETAPFLDDAMAVSLTTEFAGWMAEARRRGCRRLMLFHLGDEHGRDDRSFYAHADLVLRNYWFDDIQADPKVRWVPNGYAIGIGPAGPLLPSSQRDVIGFFAGAMAMRALSDERFAMREAVVSAGLPFTLHATATRQDRLGPAAYAARLGDARFALVPGGNSPETIRLYDALEMGCIPIMLRSRFVEAALGEPPIILLESWGDLTERYQQLALLTPAQLDDLQARVVSWWTEFKSRCQRAVARDINQVLAS